MSIPKALAELGNVIEIKLETKKEVISYTFPKTGKNIMILATDAEGKNVFGLRGKIKGKHPARKTGKTGRKYSQWSDFEADSQRTITVTNNKTRKMGNAVSISYRSDKWDGVHEYFHDFETPCAVYLDSDEDPETIIIKGRRLKVTARGIEG